MRAPRRFHLQSRIFFPGKARYFRARKLSYAPAQEVTNFAQAAARPMNQSFGQGDTDNGHPCYRGMIHDVLRPGFSPPLSHRHTLSINANPLPRLQVSPVFSAMQCILVRLLQVGPAVAAEALRPSQGLDHFSVLPVILARSLMISR